MRDIVHAELPDVRVTISKEVANIGESTSFLMNQVIVASTKGDTCSPAVDTFITRTSSQVFQAVILSCSIPTSPYRTLTN